MKIAMTGSTGLVGRAVSEALTRRGDEVVPVVRSPRAEGIHWSPERGGIQASEFEGTNAVIHLAGENIASGRWSARKKKRIRDSRVEGTALLSRTLAGLHPPPGVLVCASAMGFYGANRGDEALDEDAPPGNGFLAEVCREWEASARPAREAGIRVVHLRFGLILAREGGLLKPMQRVFRLGLGGPLGGGAQMMSWIAIDDVVRVVEWVLAEAGLDGPVNTAAPTPVTNREFAATLGRVVKRPAVLPVPACCLRLLLGEMADALALGSLKLVPARLEAGGFTFRFPELEPALRHLLK